MFTAPVGYLAFELSLVNNEEFLGMERGKQSHVCNAKDSDSDQRDKRMEEHKAWVGAVAHPPRPHWRKWAGALSDERTHWRERAMEGMAGQREGGTGEGVTGLSRRAEKDSVTLRS